MLLLCLMRVLIVPIFLFCNVQPRHNLPVIFHQDWIPIVSMAVFAISNGYLGTLCMMYGPQWVSANQREFCLIVISQGCLRREPGAGRCHDVLPSLTRFGSRCCLLIITRETRVKLVSCFSWLFFFFHVPNFNIYFFIRISVSQLLFRRHEAMLDFYEFNIKILSCIIFFMLYECSWFNL